MKGPFSSNCYEGSDDMYVKILPGKHTVYKCKFACELNFYYNKCGTIGRFGGPFINRTPYSNKSNTCEVDMLMCKTIPYQQNKPLMKASLSGEWD